MNEFWKSFLVNLGGFSAIVLGTAWVLRRLIDHFFSNKIEKYKYELEKENTKFRIIYEKLHLERAQIIKEVYQKLTFTFNEFRSYISPFQEIGDKTEYQKRESAGNAYNDFCKFYDENRIFFDEALATKIDILRSAFLGTWNKFLLSRDLKHDSSKESHKEWGEAWEKVTTEIPLIKKEIEKDFRKIIGIEES